MRVDNEFWAVTKLVGLRDDIDPQPMYQRGAVWSPPKRHMLIDSIFRGYDIPKIYLRVLPASNAHSYQIVDGQQRLSSIWDFISGEMVLPTNLPGNPSWGGKGYPSLPKSLRDKFDAFELVTAIISRTSQDDVRELFARLQQGVQLNPAEMRNSMRSDLGTQIRAVAETHDFFKSCAFGKRRYKHHDLVAHAVSLELYAGSKDLKAPALKSMYMENSSGISPSILTALDRNLTFLKRIQDVESRCIKTKWGFVDLYLLVSKYYSRLPSPKTVASRYCEFEDERLKFVNSPEALIEGRVKNKDLYNYIYAFAREGGVSDNVLKRAEAFKKLMSIR